MHERLTSEREQLLHHHKQLSIVIAKTDERIARLVSANDAIAARKEGKWKEVGLLEAQSKQRFRFTQGVMGNVTADAYVHAAFERARDVHGELDDKRAEYQLVSEYMTAVISRRNKVVKDLLDAKGKLLEKMEWVFRELLRYDGMSLHLDANGQFISTPTVLNPAAGGS